MDLFIQQPQWNRMPPYGAPAREGGTACSAQQPEVERNPRAREDSDARAYEDERAYDARRNRRRWTHGVIRILVGIVLVPVVVGLVFLASYALTCILEGAGPDELAAAFADLFERIGGFAREAVRALSAW